MTKLQSVKGMHDVLPADMPRWHAIEQRYRAHVERYGYQEIRTPILEPIELFVRGIGETTDIVEKEMFAFVDKGEDHLALRPEGTASAMRSFIQHNLGGQEPVTKLYYLGPMFRRERPAKGRFRQFYQAGAELVGSAEPAADAELIEMAYRFVEDAGLGGVTVMLNSLGDEACRPLYREALIRHFSGQREALCGDCQRRLETNPLRLIDCKVEGCRSVAKEAPRVIDYLDEASRTHFADVRRLLDRGGVRYEIVPTMVRGLDYYTRTIFEIQGAVDTLGSQATFVGGGRYDRLVEQLGGKPTPAVGFSFGLERLLLSLGEDFVGERRRLVAVVAAGEGGLLRATDISRGLRQAGFAVEVPFGEASLKSQLRRADRLEAAVVVIAGEDEATRGAVTLRLMERGEQHEVALGDLATRLAEVL